MTVAEFIDHLRLTRLARRMPAVRLAEKLGTTSSVLSGWERHAVVPTHRRLVDWATQLGEAVPDGVRGYETPALAPCGTISAYSRHRRYGETPCEPCMRVWRAYQQTYRSRGAVS